MKKIFAIILVSLLALVACGKKDSDPNTIQVGTISGPETELMETAKQVAKQTYGLNIKIITFSDYSLPNVALNDGDLDANMFQHMPYLEAAKQAHQFKITAIGKTYIYPMGIYSKKIQQLAQLENNSKIAIPNDPSNEARALLLLQKAGLITLKDNVNVSATSADIASNPKNLKLIELNAAQLPRSLDDVSLAVINTNYAIPAGLFPNKDALFVEDKTSPYANLVVVRTEQKDKEQLKELVNALHSAEVQKKAAELFQGQAIAAWDE